VLSLVELGSISLFVLIVNNKFFYPDTMYPDFLAEHKKLVDYCNDIQQKTPEQEIIQMQEQQSQEKVQ